MLMRPRQIMLAIIASLAMLFAAAPALAESPDYGTPAFSRQPLTLFEGPGSVYDVVGAIAKNQAVTVYRCSVLWCVVEQGHERGWTALRNLNFGLSPADPYHVRNYGSGSGEVCFYEGRNYTGPSLCLGPGRAFVDLLLYNLDDRFSSVSVTGDVSVSTCRDRDFQSYCSRILKSEPVLNRYLNDAVSSIRVH